MARTTEQALRALFPATDKPEYPVQHYIDDASILVTEILGASGFSDARLEMIERYLAAHYYLLGTQEGGIFEDEMGDSKVKTGSTFTLGQGLRLTRWGQQVLSLDTTGGFAQLEGGTKKTALFRLV